MIMFRFVIALCADVRRVDLKSIILYYTFENRLTHLRRGITILQLNEKQNDAREFQ